MGMAASQARLLAITARIHDVEYQAQSIQNAKVQLSTQSDQVYNEYLKALEDSTLVINSLSPDGSTSLIVANFNTLCSKNRVTPADGSVYALRDDRGRLVVEQDVLEGYEEFREAGLTDPYQFAIYMMNGRNVQHLGNLKDDSGKSVFADRMHQEEEGVYSRLNENDELEALHNELSELAKNPNDIYSGAASKEDEAAYNAKLTQYRKELYRLHGENIYNSSKHEHAENYNNDYMSHYVNIFKQIQSYGGCVSIRDYDGFNGDAANNSDWLEAMIQCGKFTIERVKTNEKTGELSFETTSVSSDSSLMKEETSKVDKTAVAKAEAKYEHDLKQIDKKDKQYDLTLSKLETERSALTTEYDSVKKVIEDNIERTFGIFS